MQLLTLLILYRGNVLCRQYFPSVRKVTAFLRSQHYVPQGVNEWRRGNYLAVIQDGRDHGDPARAEWRRELPVNTSIHYDDYTTYRRGGDYHVG